MHRIRSRSPRRTALAAAVAAGSLTLCTAPAVAVTGTAVADTTFGYTAQVIVGDHDRGCSGVLVDTEWLLTAASCFAANPAASLAVPAGKPQVKTTATIGRNDLSASGGAEREIVELVPRTDRDVVLARLNRPVTNVAPIALATTAPTAGEELKFAGYGRTATEWAPLQLHSGAFSVAASAATTATVTGQNGTAACMGDTGGPVVRVSGGTYQLAGLTSQSYQGGCYGMDAAVTSTGGVVARVDDLASWVSSKVGAPRIVDFNCDAVADVAIADPSAAVGGDANAGLVRIVYGGGKGTAEINQDLDWVPGGSEAGDRFGEAIDTVDYNEDGCTDLFVGTPAEDLGDATDAGMVDVLYGAPTGLGTGVTKNTHFEQGTGPLSTSSGETGDRLGAAVAAGTTAAGEPYLVFGVPGESIGTVAKAGGFYYARGTTFVGFNQDSTGVPGGVEANDGFGSVIAADANYIAVSAPNENLDGDDAAGNLAVFSHTLNSEGRPTPLFGLDQDLDTVSGGAEAGDGFGSSLSLVPFRSSGTAAATNSMLVVGVPGEDMSIDSVDKVDSGWVQTFQLTSTGTWTQDSSYGQGTADDDVSGTAEAGDRCGAAVTGVNTAPRAVATTATLKLAVGCPGEAIGTVAKAGAVETFAMPGAVGDNERWLEVGDGDGLPGTPGANQQVGSSIHYTGTGLYVGMPYGPSTYGTLYALPMSNVTAGGTVAAVTTYQPGTGGLPAAGTDFGYAAR